MQTQSGFDDSEQPRSFMLHSMPVPVMIPSLIAAWRSPREPGAECRWGCARSGDQAAHGRDQYNAAEFGVIAAKGPVKVAELLQQAHAEKASVPALALDMCSGCSPVDSMHSMSNSR
jgi:hypothetical protein